MLHFHMWHVFGLYSGYVWETFKKLWNWEKSVFQNFRKHVNYIIWIPVAVCSLKNVEIKMKHVVKVISCLKTRNNVVIELLPRQKGFRKHFWELQYLRLFQNYTVSENTVKLQKTSCFVIRNIARTLCLGET